MRAVEKAVDYPSSGDQLSLHGIVKPVHLRFSEKASGNSGLVSGHTNSETFVSQQRNHLHRAGNPLDVLGIEHVVPIYEQGVVPIENRDWAKLSIAFSGHRKHLSIAMQNQPACHWKIKASCIKGVTPGARNFAGWGQNFTDPALQHERVTNLMKVLVTGACGYKGTVLTPMLLDAGHEVRAVDTQWFGNFLPKHPGLEVVQADVRDVNAINLDGIDAIIHLASIANDPCGDLNPKLTWEVSALATMQLADRARRLGIEHFIYASSGSVYGVKEEEQVTEDLTLEPISEYNKTKMVAERVLLSYADDMLVQIVRPATVCGLSPRMRLDVSVNMLTMQALTNKRITVFGGNQVRPNIHMQDICRVYLYMLEQGSKIQGVFNAGFENISIMSIAEMAAKRIGAEIVVTESNDPRSYRVNSDKLLATGFTPSKTVDDAIAEIIEAYSSGALKDEDRFHNLRWMQKTVLANAA
ncbi:UDP-glucose 4-epimerase [Labrenzia sp. THAF82]|nr:UDP-glucose 4-epimerase [Labrenzia sp. THAF82]